MNSYELAEQFVNFIMKKMPYHFIDWGIMLDGYRIQDNGYVSIDFIVASRGRQAVKLSVNINSIKLERIGKQKIFAETINKLKERYFNYVSLYTDLVGFLKDLFRKYEIPIIDISFYNNKEVEVNYFICGKLKNIKIIRLRETEYQLFLTSKIRGRNFFEKELKSEIEAYFKELKKKEKENV